MGEYKFDRFYYTEDDSNEHFLSEIENISDEHFRTIYKGKMRCPECKSPQLSLVKSATGSFLRTYRGQVHVRINDQRCPYEYSMATSTVMKEYIQDLRNRRKIHSLLNAVMRKMFKEIDRPSTNFKDDAFDKKDPLLIEKIQKDKTLKRNIIPHYNFKTWGKNIPQEQLLIVYGKVYIELKDVMTCDESEQEKHQVYMHFKDMRSHKLITSCLKPHSLNIANGNYYAVILGTCHSNESKGHTYYNLWINYPIEESILLKPFPS